jgi:hypothetical protein
MSLTGWIYVTAAALAAILVGIVMITRRVIRTVPGSADSRAMTELVAELRRANDLAERRMAALETRVEALERRSGPNPG